KKSDPRGSESSGLQNYDDLYADVLLLAKNKWIDYLVPQLYWTLDMKAAPSRSLAKWWNDNAEGVDVYIGQDVQRTMNTPDPKAHDTNELATKVRISRELPNVNGNVWWHGYWVTSNMKGVADSLALRHQSTIALPPAYGDRDVRPSSVKGLQLSEENGKLFLTWHASQQKRGQQETDAVKYVVYQFFPGEAHNLEDSQAIVALTPYVRVLVGDADDDSLVGSTFMVTALDRMNRESKPTSVTLGR
ncbi:MAG: family 10 glycosylhydrolase, partial [Muribaculaceae bacterium]|nr:family 10 glycosylhydrolase [Muribaculaceae bacterium]